MNKKIISAILALTCCLGSSVMTMAQSAEPTNQMVAPRFVSTNTAKSELTISGNLATMRSTVNGKDGTRKIVVSHVLQVKSGSNYLNLTNSKNSLTEDSGFALLKDYYTVTKGKTYRVMTTAKITGPNGTDTVTKYSRVVTCK